MSKSATVDLLHQYYDAFNSGDWETMLSCIADDVRHDTNQGSQRVGIDKFREFLAHMDRCYQEQLSEIVIMASDDGQRAAAEFIVTGLYKATDEGLPPAAGQTYTLPAGTFFEIADGKIARVTTYYNLQDWIRQAGG